MSNKKEFVIIEDKQGLWISSPDVEMANIKHNIHPKGPTYHFVKMLQSENASLKEQIAVLKETEQQDLRRLKEKDLIISSLKERVNELALFPEWLLKNCYMRVLEGGKGEWHMRGEVGGYTSQEMFAKYLTNN